MRPPTRSAAIRSASSSSMSTTVYAGTRPAQRARRGTARSDRASSPPLASPAGNCYQRPEHRTVPQMPRPDPGPFTRTTDDQPRRSSPPTGMNTPDRPQTSPPTSAFKLWRTARSRDCVRTWRARFASHCARPDTGRNPPRTCSASGMRSSPQTWQKGWPRSRRPRPFPWTPTTTHAQPPCRASSRLGWNRPANRPHRTGHVLIRRFGLTWRAGADACGKSSLCGGRAGCR